nr:cell surface glycoprotein [Streptomyces sp. SID4919]
MIAYVVRLDPRLALDDETTAAERLTQWCDLLSDVPAQAQGWDASRTARDYIARHPYRIQPSDISRPWHTHKADLIGRHTGTFEPTAHPEVDPDAETGDAYLAAMRAERHAIATGRQAPVTQRALSTGPAAAEVERRLATLGTYMPRTVRQVLAAQRPRRAERERLATAGLPDPLDVPCPWEHCLADRGDPCRNSHRAPRRKPHPSRTDLATARHHAQEHTA